MGICNIRLGQVLAHHLLLGEAGDLGRLAIPLVDEAVGVDAKDGRVRRVDQERQIVGDALQLLPACLELGDVLADADDADRLAARVAARRRVQEHL